MATKDGQSNVTEGTATPATPAAEADARLTEGMAAAFGSTPTPTPPAEVVSTPTVDEPDAETPQTVSTKAEPTLDEMVGAIPTHLWRGAMHQSQYNQLQPKQLAEFWHKDPQAAEAIFQGYYEAMNQSNARAADAGRRLGNQAVVNPPAASPELQPYDPENWAADFQMPVELAQKAVAPLNAAMAQVMALRQEMDQQRQFVQRQQLNALANTVQEFFTSDSMKSFEDFYGKEFDFRHPNVMNVMQQAEYIRRGAREDGIDISAEESLRRAHDMVTAPFVSDRVRREITAKLKTRAAGVTQKPSHTSGQAVASTDAKDQRLQDGLARVFG